MLGGCAGGGGEPSTQVVSGTVAVGAALSGQVSLKDSSTPTQPMKTAVIAADGSFAFDVTNMKAPFILQADGHADGKTYRLYSFAEGPGTANVNPLSDVIVAASCDDENADEVYLNPDAEKLEKINNKIETSNSDLLEKIAPLLKMFKAEGRDPIRDHFDADHHGLDGVFDYVNITIVDGIVTISNKETGAIIFTGSVRDIRTGHYTGNDDDDDDNLPLLPVAPTAIAAFGGAGQVTISWESVGNATGYNIYYATSTGVTIDNGTKISAVTTPYVQTGLTAESTFYYIVTAVNSAGESVVSEQVSATTNVSSPVVVAPTAPTAVTATGGANQVTLAWSAVTGATSYNVYWSTTSGATTSETKITGAASPYILTGLGAGTTYYSIVTAVNSAGEGAASAQASATTNVVAPLACGSCHAIPPSSGKHAYHVNTRNYSCDRCHGTGYSKTTINAATHDNGVVNFANSLTSWNASAGTCTNLCHGSRSW